MADKHRPKSTPEVSSKPGRGPRRRGVDSPRTTHGTRVAFRVDCARCGKADTLPFVPRTQGDLLCRVCAEAVFGENWAHGRPVKKRKRYSFECTTCGRPGEVPFEPVAGRELRCAACFRGEDPPTGDRLKRMKRVD